MDNFLLLTVVGIIIVVIILAVVLVVMTMKEKKENDTRETKKVDDEVDVARAKKSMFKFMEFDGIEDNMIVQDGGKRYLMVLECKGVNYDLLSEVEKNGVEQGFISFLNALKFEVQLYVQTRMIACTAHLAGFDLNSDQVQTFVYACLAGVSVNEVIKQTGIKFGIKFTTKMVEKIPGKALTKINQKVGFRFLTKFGEKGLINIGKAVPVVGAVIGGGLDLVETKIIANRAYKWFFEHDFSSDEETEEESIEIIEECGSEESTKE